ncbi:TetR/AcrR family transcriptional regulator [Asanoa sp. NPDC049518]|uniref:TetR/AcrR family transcriptional regulator n=1 Tax=unclassified Asanoa TaxID=2685164 RepID=UPI0034152FBB
MSAAAQSRNRRGEGERLRDALLTAAADLLSEDPDIDHLSVRTITARAGVTHTAMYLHFADKQALIEAMKTACFAELTQALTDAVHDVPDDPVAGLRAAGEAYLRFGAARPGHYAVMFHSARAGVADTPDTVRSAGMRAFHQLVDLAAAVVGEADAHDAATNMWLALHGRITIRRSMPWFPMSDDITYVREQVNALTQRRPRTAPVTHE